MTPSPIYVFLVIGTFILFSLPYRKINRSLLISPMSVPILTFVISFFTVLSLYNENFIAQEAFNSIILVFAVFAIALIATPYILAKKASSVFRDINIGKFDIQITDWLFYSNIVISLAYAALLWGSYSDGSDRLLLNKDYRALSLLSILYNDWAAAMVSLIYAKTKNKKYLLFFSIIAIFSAAKGSKSEAFGYLLIFSFFYLQFNSVTTKQKISAAFVFVVFIFLPTQLMYGNAFDEILFRTFMSGDVYLLSFVTGDYTQLIDFYNPLLYVLHPFTSLVGIRGYEFPFGAQLLSTVGMEVTGTGPNDHLSMLALVFFDKCWSCILIFSIFFALLYSASIAFAFFILRQTRLHVFFRVFVFITLYANSINIFIGIGLYTFRIIILLIASILYLALVYFKNSKTLV